MIDVVIKGGWKEYGEAQILQMAGRAGRPQHCSQATVVIMTEVWNVVASRTWMCVRVAGVS